MGDAENAYLLLSDEEAEYAMTLDPDEFWSWWTKREET